MKTMKTLSMLTRLTGARRPASDRAGAPAGNGAVSLLLVFAWVVVLPGCDSLPFVGGTPSPELEWETREPGSGLFPTVASVEDGEVTVRGLVRIPDWMELHADLESGSGVLTIWIDPTPIPGIYTPGFSIWREFEARITRLRRGSYELRVICRDHCCSREPRILLEETVTVE